jgi:hypothetical protein
MHPSTRLSLEQSQALGSGDSRVVAVWHVSNAVLEVAMSSTHTGMGEENVTEEVTCDLCRCVQRYLRL